MNTQYTSPQKKLAPKKAVESAIWWAGVLVLSVFFLFPFVIMVCRSFFTTAESLSSGAGLIPRKGFYARSYEIGRAHV